MIPILARLSRIRLSAWSCTIGAAAALIVGVGCPSSPPSGGDGSGTNTNSNDNASTDEGVRIVNVPAVQAVSELLDFVSILYNATGVSEDAEVNAFYVPVDSPSVDAEEIGDRVPIETATPLPIGTNQTFQFKPGETGTGSFRVGITVVDGIRNIEALSTGILYVQGPPDPRFVLPSSAVTEVEQGETVEIRFDAGDPEGIARWRLFYLPATDPLAPPPDTSPDVIGTQLTVGDGNAGTFIFGTADLTPGRYEMGVSATDTGDSVAATVERGDADLVVTTPAAETPEADRRVIVVTESVDVVPPTIAFLVPGSSGVELFGDEALLLQFQITAAPGQVVFFDLFHDTDADPSNGVTIIEDAISLPSNVTSYPFPTDLQAGTYRVGATLRQGTVDPVTTYAAGPVEVVRTPTLTVTAPNSTIPIRPLGAEDNDTATVAWTTNVPPSAGMVDVFARTVDATGIPFGPEIPVLDPTSTTVTSTEFGSEFSGTYQISVRIEFDDPDFSTLIRTAPSFVRVSSAPAVLWLGALAQETPSFDGAIFEGVNFEDNAGTSLSTAGDLDGDGLDEFVIGARYGKPFFINPSGIGPGEAYLVYGGSGGVELKGLYNLNTLGTVGLPGVLLTGIRTAGDSNDTDGLSDITLIPDVDADAKDELVFGFPRTNSAGGTAGPLEAAGQFLNGGVVILSSNNSILENPSSGTPVINLGNCGQRFSNTSTTADDEDLVVTDALAFTEGDPNDDPPTTDGCEGGSDDVLDTVIGPSTGFISLLAPAAYTNFAFTVYPEGTNEADGICITEFEPPTCTDALGRLVFGETESGSGFYTAAANPLEPRGARIIGQEAGDGFGTSVTISKPLGTGRGDLIISAPNRTAMGSLVDGIDNDIPDSGVAFLAPSRNLWGSDSTVINGATPPTPYQYVMGRASNCGDGRAPTFNPLRITGDANDSLRNIIGIEDFNNDGRNDFAVGAPNAGGGQGRVYIAFRREQSVEGDFVLDKLELDPTSPERLTGVLIVTDAADALGSSLATDVDFNGDGVKDLVVGSPNANGGQGEVIVIFGDPNLTSPVNGISVDTLLNTRNTQGFPRAARITGNPLDPSGNFGFNVANAGDIDGDGTNDLLIAAPGATPRFDSDPADDTDELNDPGVDANLDGLKDDVSGPNGLPDGIVDTFDNLDNAGIVFVILGSNRLDDIATADITISAEDLGTNLLRGFMIAGRRQGDRIGGGDAGTTADGGIAGKQGRGRSFGLASAGDVDGDGRDDMLIGSILADPRRDPNTGVGIQNGGEAYLVYGSVVP